MFCVSLHSLTLTHSRNTMGKSKAVDTATSTAPASEKSTATDPRTADKDDGATPTPGLATLLRVLAFSSRRDRAIQILSAAAAVAAGAAMPLMALILGRLTANITSFGSASASSTSPASASHFMDNISTNALWFVYLFIGKFFLVYIWGFGFTYAANRTVQALRLRVCQFPLVLICSSRDNPQTVPSPYPPQDRPLSRCPDPRQPGQHHYCTLQCYPDSARGPLWRSHPGLLHAVVGLRRCFLAVMAVDPSHARYRYPYNGFDWLHCWQ